MTLFDESIKLLDKRVDLLDPDNFNIVYMGDSWVEKSDVPHYSFTSNEIFTTALNAAKNYNPLLILHGGDIVYSGTKDLLQNFVVQKGNLIPDIPLFVVVGNHEMEPTPSGPWSIKNFEDIIGPVHFLLNVPEYQLTLIAVNTLYKYVYKEYGLTAEELEFLRTSLKKKLLSTFVSTHVPPRSYKWQDPDDSFDINHIPFLEEIEDKVSKALVSHIHAFDTAEIYDTDFILSGGAGAPLNVNQVNHIVVINISNEFGRRRIRFRKVPVGWD